MLTSLSSYNGGTAGCISLSVTPMLGGADVRTYMAAFLEECAAVTAGRVWIPGARYPLQASAEFWVDLREPALDNRSGNG
jgi:hypothetical protein